MKQFIGKITMRCDWVVELEAESFEDAEARLTQADWDVTKDMEMIAPAEIIELFELDGAELPMD